MEIRTEKLTMTISEAARILGISRARMRHLVDEKRFKIVPDIEPVLLNREFFFRKTGLNDPQKSRRGGRDNG